MPVFQKNDKKILFIHIPKAGGTSIEHLFKSNGWDMSFFDGGGKNSVNNFLKCSPQHMHFNMLKDIMRINSFDYIFTFTRDPIERLKSEYKWRKKYLNENMNFNDWFDFTFENYKNNSFIHDNHIRPQSEFIGENVNHFKIEEGIKKSFNKFIHQIDPNFNLGSIPSVMKSDNVDEFNLTNEQTSTLIEFYQTDFILFNYKLSEKYDG